jgi:methionyl-tRNA formyltransferase
MLDEQPVKIWRARIVERSGEPGVVQQAGDELVITCGEGALAVAELQRAGARRLSAQEFLRGHRLPAGARFT